MVTTPNGSPFDRFAQVLLDVAAEVEAAEAQIRQAIIDAARAGDCERVLSITEQWRTKPPVEVAAHALIPASERR